MSKRHIIALLLSLFLNGNSYGMGDPENDNNSPSFGPEWFREQMHAKNVFGHTPLHLTSVILNEATITPQKLQKLDQAKAYMAASMILEYGCSVNEKDNAG